MKLDLEERDNAFQDLERKYHNLQSNLDTMRYDYMKDLCHLRDVLEGS